MSTQNQIKCFGRFSKEFLAKLPDLLQSIYNAHLLEYKIISTHPSPSKKQNSEIILEYELPQGAICLEDLILSRQTPLELDQRRKLIAAIWKAFQVVSKAVMDYSELHRLLCLHPQNIYVIQRYGKAKSVTKYDIIFAKYIPDVFYADVVQKKNRTKKNGLYKTITNEFIFISPRFLNSSIKKAENISAKFDVLVGPITISYSDMYYSLGLVFLFIETGLLPPSDRVSLEQNLNDYFHGRIRPVHENSTDSYLRQFIEKMISMKSTPEEIESNFFVSVLEGHMSDREMSLEDIEMIDQITTGDFSDDYTVYQKMPDGSERVVVGKQFDLKKDGVCLNDVVLEFDRMNFYHHKNFLEAYSVFKLSFSDEMEDVECSGIERCDKCDNNQKSEKSGTIGKNAFEQRCENGGKKTTWINGTYKRENERESDKNDKNEKIDKIDKVEKKVNSLYDQFNQNNQMNQNNQLKYSSLFNSIKDISKVEETENETFEFAYILLEYCDLGTLTQYAQRMYQSGCIDKEFIEYVFIELLSGIWFLHSEQMTIHGDIKPDHILLKSECYGKEKLFYSNAIDNYIKSDSLLLLNNSKELDKMKQFNKSLNSTYLNNSLNANNPNGLKSRERSKSSQTLQEKPNEIKQMNLEGSLIILDENMNLQENIKEKKETKDSKEKKDSKETKEKRHHHQRHYPLIKIIGMGNAQRITSHEDVMKTTVGTKQYMAPELQSSTSKGYTYKIDLWSLAVTMYQLVTYQLPFGSSSLKIINSMLYQIKPIFVESQWSELEELKNVIQHLLVFDEDERWGWPQLFRNNYICKLLQRKKQREFKIMGQKKSKEEIVKMVEDDNAKRKFSGLFTLQYKK